MENNEDCNNCQSMREQVEELKRKHLLDFRTIKQKIISTDELIKLYQKKCQEFDKQTKCLSELTTKLEASQRNMDVVHVQLQKSFELNEPLKKACNELEKEKELRKIEMQKLQDKLRGSENLASQLKTVVKEKERSERSFKLDAVIQGQVIEEKKKSLKKSEAMVTKLKEQIMAEKSGKKEINKQLTSSQNQLKKKEKQVGDSQEMIANLKEKLNEAKKEITELKKRLKEKIYSPSPPKHGRTTRKTFTLKQQKDTVEKSTEILIDEIMDRMLLDLPSCFSLSPLPPSPYSAEKTADITDDDDGGFGNDDPDYIDDNNDGDDDGDLCDDGSTQSVNNVEKQKNVSESTASESVCSEPMCAASELGDSITNSTTRKTDRDSCSTERNSGTLDKDVATEPRSTPLSTTLMSKKKRTSERLRTKSEICTPVSEFKPEGKILKTKNLSENTNAEKSRERPHETKTTKTESENHLTNSKTDNSETNLLNARSSCDENTILITSTCLADSRSKARTEEVEQEVSDCMRSIIEAVELQEGSPSNLRSSRVDYDSSFVIETNFETGLVNNSFEIIHDVEEDVLDCLKSVIECVSNTVKHPSACVTTDVVVANLQDLTRNEQADAAIVVSDKKTSLICNQWHENVDDDYRYSEGSSVSSNQAKGSSSFFDIRNGRGKTDGKRSASGILGNAAKKADLKRYTERVLSNGEKPRDLVSDSRFNTEMEIDKELAGIGGLVVIHGCSNKAEGVAENISGVVGTPLIPLRSNKEKPKDSESDSRFDSEGEIDKELAGIGGLVVIHGCSNKAESDLQEDAGDINSGVTTNGEKPRDLESDSCNTKLEIDNELAGVGGLVVMACNNAQVDGKEHSVNIGPKTKTSEADSCFNQWEHFEKVDILKEGSSEYHLNSSLTFAPDLPTPLSPIPDSPKRPIQYTEIPCFEELDDLPPLSPIPPSPKGLSSTVDPRDEDSETIPHEELELQKLAEMPSTSTVSKLPEHASPLRVAIPAKQFSADDANIAEKSGAPARQNKTPIHKAPAIKDSLDRSPKAKEHGYVSRLLTKVKKDEITTEVATKRFSIITNLRASSPFVSALIQILKSTSDAVEDELIKKYTEQCVSDETRVWQPVITEFEMRVVVVVRELSKLKQFDGLICCLLSLLGKTMFGLFRSGDAGNSAVLAICRVYTTVCRLMGDGGRVRVLCFDIMKENQRHLLTNKVIMSVGLVWPEVLRKNERVPSLLPGELVTHGPGHQPFLSTLQVITMSRETSSEFEHSTLVLQRLCGWSKIPCGQEALELQAFQLVRLLRESSELAAQHTTSDFGPSMESEAFEAVKSLELLAVVLGWQWTNDVLVRDQLWPVLEEWKRSELYRSGAVEGANGNLGSASNCVNKVELARDIASEKNETVVGNPQMEITMEVGDDSQGTVVGGDSEIGLKEIKMDAKTTDHDNYCGEYVEEISDCMNEHKSNVLNGSNGFHSEAKLRTSSKDMPGMNEVVDCSDPKTEERIGLQTTDVNSVTTRTVVMDMDIMPLKRISENLGDQDEREPSIEKHNMEATVVSVLRLLGLLGLVGLQQEHVDLDAMVNLMCAVMACIHDVERVTFAIQLAAAYAALDMIKTNPMKILNALNEWTARMDDEKGVNIPARFTEQLQYFRTYLSTTKPL